MASSLLANSLSAIADLSPVVGGLTHSPFDGGATCSPSDPLLTLPTSGALTAYPSPRSPFQPPTVPDYTNTSSQARKYVRLNSCRSSSPRRHVQSTNSESPLSNSSYDHVSLNNFRLASRHGIPLIFPEPPSTRPRNNPLSLNQPVLSHFKLTLASMVSSSASRNPTADKHTENMTAPTSTDLTSPMFSDLGDDFLMSPPNEFLTSPVFSSYGDFSDGSPYETPLDSFLTTPIFQDIHEPLIAGEHDYPLDLFGGHDLLLPLQQEQKLPTSIDPTSLIAPRLPPSPQEISSPLATSPAPAATPAPKTRKPRKPSAVTGTRKNISPETMVSMEAPTQTRKYQAPSATSRKELPATFLKKKRARSEAFGDDDDPEEILPPNATEMEQIEFKRRQNTLAARKSRKRKLEHQRGLETRLEELQAQLTHWKTRAELCEGLLKEKGLSVPSA